MKRAAVLVSALALVVFTAGLGAQAKPTFAGKWTLQVDPNAAPPAGGGGGGRGGGGGGGRGVVAGMEVNITQDATSITIDRMQGQAAVKYVVKLDGSDSVNTVQGRGGEMKVTTKATWDGSKLKLTSTQDGQNGPVTSTQVLSMDGGNLVVESTAPGRDGAPATTKATYKKS